MIDPDPTMVPPPHAPLLLRRIVAAAPEFVLAAMCYQGALDALSGTEPSLYLYGLIAIELIGLAWLRLALSPLQIAAAKSGWRRLLGIGGTGVALIVVLLNSMLLLVAFLFVMVFEPRTFVLLLLALTRRSLWRWAWAIRSVSEARLLQDQARRAFRAHALALLASVIAAVGLNLLLRPDDEVRAQVGDALWLAGMAGYFSALAIYLLFGRTPLEEDKPGPPAANPPPRLARAEVWPLAKVAAGNPWPLIPGVLLLWFVMEVAWKVVDPAIQVFAAPIGAGMGGWLLIAGAAGTLRVTEHPPWRHGFPRAGDFLLRICLLWIGAGAAAFFSVPIVAGILDLEVRAGDYPPSFQTGFILAMLVILYGLIRLWPLVVYPFVITDEPAPPAIPHGVRDAWRMTAGWDGFVRGALPPALILAAALALLAFAGNLLFLAKAAVYLAVAPLLAVVAVERTLAMAVRQPSGEGAPAAVPAGSPEIIAPKAGRLGTRKTETAGRDATRVVPIPLPMPPHIPMPRPAEITARRAPSPARVPPSQPLSREFHYSPDWSDRDVYGSALYNEDIPTAARMLEKGVPLDSEIGDGDPALLWTARMGKPGSFRFLLDRGADVYGRARLGGAGVLHYAAATPAIVPFLAELLEWGESIDGPDSWGHTPFISACRAGCLDGARALLARGANPRLTDKQGSTALHHFINRLQGANGRKIGAEQLAFIKELLALGLDPLAIGAYGRHAVSIAAERGLDPVLEIFREAGVDLARPDRTGLSALNAAAINGRLETARQIHASGQPLDLPGAIAMGDRGAVERLLRERPGLVREKLGETGVEPLGLAVRHGQAEIVQHLLAAGADPRASSGWGGSILHNAVRHLPNPAILAALIEHGAAVDASDGDMNTPLNFAARDDALEVAEFLLKAGANPNAETERGYPVKMFAKSEQMKALLQRYGAK